MRLVIGGAYQGKLEYAKHTYGISDGWADGRSCAFAEMETCRGMHHFHEYVRRLLFENSTQSDTSEVFSFHFDDLAEIEHQADLLAGWLSRKNPAIVLVSDELGYGVVPTDWMDRLWRETTGRICTSIAARADSVVRVVCGIGMRLR